MNVTQHKVSQCAEEDEEADEYQGVGPNGQRRPVVTYDVLYGNDAPPCVARREVGISRQAPDIWSIAELNYVHVLEGIVHHREVLQPP